MNLKRGLLALTTAALLAFVLSGCFVIVNDSPSQDKVIGDAVVHTEMCISGATTDSCSNQGNSQTAFGAFGDTAGQLLLAYRIPDGYGAPTQVSSTSGTPQLVMDANQSYVDQLTALAPPPGGEHWVGYMSASVTPANNASYVFDSHFPRPPSQNGVPSSVPFTYLTVTGGRGTSDDPMDNRLPSRVLNCGASFHELTGNQTTDPMMFTPPVDDTTCIDSPGVAPSATQLPGDSVLFPRDLAVAAGSASASRNTTANVPFTLNYVGATNPAALFTLASSVTGLSGATASPVNPTFTPPSNSSTVQNVAVKVPLKAPAGTYNVPFSATLANGETRQAVGKLTVLPDTKGPGVTISFAKLRLKKASKGIKVTVGCSEDCSLLATLTAGSKALAAKTVKLGSAKASLPAAGKKTLTVKLNRTGKRKLGALAKRHKHLKTKLTIVATDALGHRTSASKTLSFK
jgi:hypothetical protein